MSNIGNIVEYWQYYVILVILSNIQEQSSNVQEQSTQFAVVVISGILGKIE